VGLRHGDLTMLIKPLLAGLVAALTCIAAQAEEPRKIAFVDTGNTGRSVSAEAISNALIAQRKLHVAVISRAVDMDPFDVHPEPNAVKLLADRGLDVKGHIATQMTLNDARHADVVLTMTAKHKAKVIELYPEVKDKAFTLAEYATGTTADVPDAWGKPMEVYVAMIKQLDSYLPAAIDKAVATAPKK
jgi:protein-tyrosine phosphatase